MTRSEILMLRELKVFKLRRQIDSNSPPLKSKEAYQDNPGMPLNYCFEITTKKLF
jgi:hypothetical protein